LNETVYFSIAVDQEIELRLLDEADAPVVFALIESNREHLRRWLPWVDSEISLEIHQDFIRKARQRYLDNEGCELAIWYQGAIVGVIGLHTLNWPNKRVAIGYWLARDFEGRGIMTRASRAITRYAFTQLLLNKVEIHCATGNIRSCAIPQKLGFTRDGILRDDIWLYDHFVDVVVYSMLAREWSSISQPT
jgi:ribosomal-protein-serine acetyltransferase